MTEEKNAALTTKYPKLFTGFQNPKGGYYPFWFETGDGWYELIDSLASDIQNYVDHQEESYSWKVERGEAKEEDRPHYQVRAVQVKQKFGGLRFYIEGGNDYIDGMVTLAESMSYKICETCGHPGKPNKSGWINTFCDPCRELDNKRREEYITQYKLARNVQQDKESGNG